MSNRRDIIRIVVLCVAFACCCSMAFASDGEVRRAPPSETPSKELWHGNASFPAGSVTQGAIAPQSGVRLSSPRAIAQTPRPQDPFQRESNSLEQDNAAMNRSGADRAANGRASQPRFDAQDERIVDAWREPQRGAGYGPANGPGEGGFDDRNFAPNSGSGYGAAAGYGNGYGPPAGIYPPAAGYPPAPWYGYAQPYGYPGFGWPGMWPGYGFGNGNGFASRWPGSGSGGYFERPYPYHLDFYKNGFGGTGQGDAHVASPPQVDVPAVTGPVYPYDYPPSTWPADAYNAQPVIPGGAKYR